MSQILWELKSIRKSKQFIKLQFTKFQIHPSWLSHFKLVLHAVVEVFFEDSVITRCRTFICPTFDNEPCNVPPTYNAWEFQNHHNTQSFKPTQVPDIKYLKYLNQKITWIPNIRFLISMWWYRFKCPTILIKIVTRNSSEMIIEETPVW